jgi:ATP-dependent RNA helicase DHX29
LSLPKAQRGIATTSVASKKQVEDAKAVKEAEATAQAEQEAAAAAPPAEVAPSLEDSPTSGDTHDWEAENYVEEQSLQALVERLNDKGEKEVTRVVKVSRA